ncbi:hypothetical protein SK128_009940 [Halocaridina rubra]|uniref:Uncharacterized protein n=1 Tax=Halocaridina rubra TaxID=373956 RepID=A0AAN9AGE3_HALRR
MCNLKRSNIVRRRRQYSAEIIPAKTRWKGLHHQTNLKSHCTQRLPFSTDSFNFHPKTKGPMNQTKKGPYLFKNQNRIRLHTRIFILLILLISIYEIATRKLHENFEVVPEKFACFPESDWVTRSQYTRVCSELREKKECLYKILSLITQLQDDVEDANSQVILTERHMDYKSREASNYHKELFSLHKIYQSQTAAYRHLYAHYQTQQEKLLLQKDELQRWKNEAMQYRRLYTDRASRETCELRGQIAGVENKKTTQEIEFIPEDKDLQKIIYEKCQLVRKVEDGEEQLQKLKAPLMAEKNKNYERISQTQDSRLEEQSQSDASTFSRETEYDKEEMTHLINELHELNTKEYNNAKRGRAFSEKLREATSESINLHNYIIESEREIQMLRGREEREKDTKREEEYSEKLRRATDELGILNEREIPMLRGKDATETDANREKELSKELRGAKDSFEILSWQLQKEERGENDLKQDLTKDIEVSERQLKMLKDKKVDAKRESDLSEELREAKITEHKEEEQKEKMEELKELGEKELKIKEDEKTTASDKETDELKIQAEKIMDCEEEVQALRQKNDKQEKEIPALRDENEELKIKIQTQETHLEISQGSAKDQGEDYETLKERFENLLAAYQKKKEILDFAIKAMKGNYLYEKDLRCNVYRVLTGVMNPAEVLLDMKKDWAEKGGRPCESD